MINFSTTIGFPQLQIALVSDQGFIEAFPIDGLVYETFPKLQFKRYDPFSTISGTYNNGPSCFLWAFEMSNDNIVFCIQKYHFSYLIVVQSLNILVCITTMSFITYLVIQTLMLWSIFWMKENELKKLKDAKFLIFICN